MSATRDLRVEVTDYRKSGYDEDGEWMDGDVRDLSDPITILYTWQPERYDPDNGQYPDAETFAVEIATVLGAVEPNVYPIPDQLQDSAWLSAITDIEDYEGPNWFIETTIRLLGDWTPEERANVFRRSVKF